MVHFWQHKNDREYHLCMALGLQKVSTSGCCPSWVGPQKVTRPFLRLGKIPDCTSFRLDVRLQNFQSKPIHIYSQKRTHTRIHTDTHRNTRELDMYMTDMHMLDDSQLTEKACCLKAQGACCVWGGPAVQGGRGPTMEEAMEDHSDSWWFQSSPSYQGRSCS